MSAALTTDIADFTRRDLTFGGKTKPVLVTGLAGPAIVVLPEVFGVTPTLTRFCRWVRDAGFRVYVPAILGKPNATNEAKPPGLGTIVRLCVAREFYLFSANRPSPIVDWLKELARLAHAECGGPGVGVIGMCITGSFALSMAVDPVVTAPVMAQPGLPALRHSAVQMSAEGWRVVSRRIAHEGMSVRGYRFQGDKLCRTERFVTLRERLGSGFFGNELPDSASRPGGMDPPHSVFTGDLIDEAGQPTREAINEVIAFFREKLKG